MKAIKGVEKFRDLRGMGLTLGLKFGGKGQCM